MSLLFFESHEASLEGHLAVSEMLELVNDVDDLMYTNIVTII